MLPTQTQESILITTIMRNNCLCHSSTTTTTDATTIAAAALSDTLLTCIDVLVATKQLIGTGTE
jgi:hypothetical protein